MATYSKEFVWIIPVGTKVMKAYSRGKAEALACAHGVPLEKVRKTLRGVRAQIRRVGQPALSRTFPTKGAAEVWVAENERRILNGVVEDMSVARSMTVESLLEDYCEHEDLGKQDRSRVKLLVRHLGKIGMDRLHAADCLQFVRKRRGSKAERLAHYERWLDRQVKSGWLEPEDADELRAEAHAGRMELPPVVRDSTIQRDIDVLASAIRWARMHRKLVLSHNPIPEIKQTLVVKNQRDRRPTDAELAALFEASDSPILKPFIELAIETCMRRGELTAMRIEDIDWDNELLRIPKEKADRLKGGRKPGRVIPLTKRAKEILKQVVGDRNSGSVFGVQPDSISQAFSRACKRARVRDLVLHDLRHHGVSRLFEETGLSAPEVQLISGHASIQSLERYVNMQLESVREKLRLAGK